MLVKGLDLTERAELLSAQLRPYARFIETDYSRFDRTISLPFLRDVQNSLFLMVNKDPMFARALELTLNTKGKSALGVTYNIEGTRCSGDAHTSLGNGLINAFITFTSLSALTAEEWTSIHEGDDGVIGVVETAHQAALNGLQIIPFLGFNVKQDVYNQIDDVSFCGRHYYSTPDGFREHADVLRSLDKFHTTVSNCKAMPLIRAKAMSYYATDATTPLIGPLCYALLQATEGVSFSAMKRASRSDDRWITRDQELDFNADRPLMPISWEARISVYRRTDITPLEQIWYEQHYLQMATRKTILCVPQIRRDWNIREDGHIYGRVSDWIRWRE